MIKRWVIFLCALGLIELAGCTASAPRFSEIAGSIAPLGPGMGRIFVLRDREVFGSGLTPPVDLNGAAIGKLAPGSFLYVNRATGPCTLSVAVPGYGVSRAEFALASGATVYVAVSWGRLARRGELPSAGGISIDGADNAIVENTGSMKLAFMDAATAREAMASYQLARSP